MFDFFRTFVVHLRESELLKIGVFGCCSPSASTLFEENFHQELHLMAKSQDSYSKKEKEKNRRKKQKEKEERKQQRKTDKADGKGGEMEFSYVDENGNLSSTPPDPSKKFTVKAEDIQLGAAFRTDEPEEVEKKGFVKFFNAEKGYGFITEAGSKDTIFVHINDASEELRENNKVTFEIEMGPKGPKAVRVKVVR